MKYLPLAFVYSVLAVLFSPCTFAQPRATALTLSQNGRSSYVITLAADAIPAEKTAAAQLQEHLQKVTGATFAIKSEADVAANAPQILIGAGSRVKRLLPTHDWSALGSDGIVIQTVGSNLVLAGGRPRGALYAVFEFLEKQVGVRWWTPTESMIPKQSTLSIPALSTIYTPQISTREAYYISLRNDPLFATRMKINGQNQSQDETLGGHNSMLGFVHTFDQLLPPTKYFKEHPEWYSDPFNGGKPCTAASPMPEPQRSQLNLTNDAMRAEMTRNAFEWIRKNPQAGTISISQNDNENYCRSEGDMAIIEREGAPSGALIHFVNQVAADVEKEFPGFMVETLAYQYSRKPPLHARPRQNVIIRLCLDSVDFSRPLDSASNAVFHDNVQGWKAIAPRLYFWDYVGDYTRAIFPHPNWRVLAPNIRYFVANNAISVFEQGDMYSNGTGDFPQLRAWLLSHLLWDPSRDEKQLLDEFMTGYYGAAAEPLKQYQDLMVEAFEASGGKLGSENTNDNYLTLEVMHQADALFEASAKSVAGNDVLIRRVRRARLPLDNAWIFRQNALKRQALVDGKEFRGPTDIRAFAEDFIQTAESFDVVEYREAGAFSVYATKVRARLAPPVALPVELQDKVQPGAEDEKVIDVQQPGFRLFGEGDYVSIVDDEAASDGKAARMRGNAAQWAIQYSADVERGYSWHCFVVARVETKAGMPLTGDAIDCGIYNSEKRATVTQLLKTVKDMAGGEYQVLDMGVHPLPPGADFWVAPTNNPNVEAVYVDRIILLRESDAPQM